jgi:hypothetical protein
MDLVWRAGKILCRSYRARTVITAGPRTTSRLCAGDVAIVAGFALGREFAARLVRGAPVPALPVAG